MRRAAGVEAVLHRAEEVAAPICHAGEENGTPARGTQDIDGRKLLQKGAGAYFAVAPATRARLARVRNMVLGAFVFSLNVMPHGPVIGLQSGPAVGPS